MNRLLVSSITDALGIEEAGIYVIIHTDRILYVGQSKDVSVRLCNHLEWRTGLAWKMIELLDDPVKIETCEVVIIPQALCSLCYPNRFNDEEWSRRSGEAEVIANFCGELNWQHQDSEIGFTYIGQALRGILHGKGNFQALRRLP